MFNLGPARAVALLAVASSVASCAGAPLVAEDHPVVERRIDESSIVDALGNSGTLVLSGGCLALDEPGSELATIVWPEGRVTWDAQTDTVTMTSPGLTPLVATIGEQVSISGSRTSSTSGFDWATRPADGCPTTYLVTG